MTADLFFSYRRQDLERARPLLEALAEAGVRAWRDMTDIPDQDSITAGIRDGIAGSKAFLAFYSAAYPLSNPCQQEITMAWVASQRMDGGVNRRVWIVNPEPGFDHLPVVFRDQQLAFSPTDCANIAAQVKNRLAALDGTLGRAAGLPRYYGMAPVQAKRFVGRAAALWDLHGLLTANQLSIVTGVYGQAAAQLRGLGGNGKSLLAREYAIRFGSAYPGGVFWVNCYGHNDTRESVRPEQREALRHDQIRQFAMEFGVATEGIDAEQIEIDLWRAIERRGERCLWIVDDLPSGLDTLELQRVWTAPWAGASTLVTTRSKEYGTLGDVLDLGVLSAKEALDLLRSHREPVDDAELHAAEDIVALLGCHPLAVEVAGSYLAQGLETFESYRDALSDPTEDAVEFGKVLKEVLPTGHERGISATLLKSIRQLEPEGLDFLRLASVLAVAPIPVSFVAEAFNLLSSEGKMRALKAVDQAASLSLCESARKDERTVHTLLSRTMRFQYPGEERTLRLRTAAVEALTSRLQRLGHIGDRSRDSSDIPHARHLVSDDLQTEPDATLAHWLALRDHERGHYRSSRNLEQRVLAARHRLLGNEHPATLVAMHNLARTMYEQGELGAARNMQENLLAVVHRLAGEEDTEPFIFAVMNNLSQTLYAQGDLSGARAMSEQVLAGRRRLLGEDHRDTLEAMHNLAWMLKTQGELDAARELQAQALAAMRRVLGEEHPDTVTAMSNFAQTLYQKGDLTGARNFAEEVLAIRGRVLGEDHPDTITASHNLAWMLKAQGELDAARNLQAQALAALRRVLGEEHPLTITAMNNLAQMLYSQGDLAAARTMADHVLKVRSRVLGEKHPDTVTAMNLVARMLREQGDLAAARKMSEHVLAVRRRVLGEEHPDTVAVMHDCAWMLRAQGDLAEARTMAEQVLNIRLRVLGEEHDDTLGAMQNIAQTLYAQGDVAGARKMSEHVLAVRRRVLGEEHPDTFTAMHDCAWMLRAQGDLAGARKMAEQVLDIGRRVLGEEHPETLVARKNLAQTLYAQGDLPGARTMSEQVLAIRRRVLGDEHPKTVEAMHDVASTLTALGDLRAGRKLQEAVLAAMGRSHGHDHPDTFRAMHNLAQTVFAQGDLVNACELQRKALAGMRQRLGDNHPDTVTAMNTLAKMQ